jgi:hypothetical protein
MIEDSGHLPAAPFHLRKAAHPLLTYGISWPDAVEGH